MTALLQFASTCVCSLQHTAAETRATPLSRWKQNISIRKREDAHRKRHRLTPPVPSAIVAISSRFQISALHGRRRRNRHRCDIEGYGVDDDESITNEEGMPITTDECIWSARFFLSTILILYCHGVGRLLLSAWFGYHSPPDDIRLDCKNIHPISKVPFNCNSLSRFVYFWEARRREKRSAGKLRAVSWSWDHSWIIFSQMRCDICDTSC